ncbi:MAG TPA: 16S rRNA (adenine(1518)-N(6)/adenine(1519)-N(6))-dimethyltransferase RsmA [Candidatus Acidoferrum sp.]|nr:16S rRNA (adenine(1518)-N(6)/adenine(1519)-N(6))-dimethyltransferase RsmA [Candidatus Acidoferrum sp.]
MLRPYAIALRSRMSVVGAGVHWAGMARQRLGQHFLADPDWREQIARAIRVSAHSSEFSVSPAHDRAAEKPYCWIEIGAGHGEMTEHLAETGAPVTAIEIDAPLVRRLKHLTQQYPNLQVVSNDVLKVDIAEIAAGRRARIYGNLPYYITSPILHHLFEFAPIIDEIHIVIQLEVAERLAARPGGRDYGYLSVATQMYSRPEIVLKIPREAFDPPPEVASALVSLKLPGLGTKIGDADKEQVLDFVKLCFAQKRKTLVNNLKALGKADRVRAAMEGVGLRADARAEQLKMEEFVELWRELKVEKSEIASE